MAEQPSPRCLRLGRWSLFQESVNSGLCYRFVNFGFRATGRYSSKHFAINDNWQPALIRKKIWHCKDFRMTVLHGVRAILGRLPIMRRVTRLSLSKFQRIDWHAVCFFNEKQVAAVVHDADGYFH